MNRQPWAYYKLYPGRNWNRHESLLLAACAQLYSRDDLEQVFFLRYWDSQGLHLRLRYRAAAAADADAAPPAAAAAGFDGLIAGIAQLPEDDYRPAIVPPGGLQLHDNTPPQLVEDTYEPEIAKYGERGIHHAERLFHHSSRLAHDILVDERSGSYSRKSIVPRVMYDTVRDLGGNADDAQFWDSYAQYWIGGQQQWLPQFRHKAADLRAAGVAVIADDASLPEAFAPRLAAWRAALARVGADYRACQNDLAADLPAHMVHLTNNRLGVSTVEEAYYATLISASLP